MSCSVFMNSPWRYLSFDMPWFLYEKCFSLVQNVHVPQQERVVVSVEDPIYRVFALLSTSLHVFEKVHWNLSAQQTI